MPKQTFFNLPKEKKQKLIQAAYREFSRVPMFEASITNIIQEAGIPRGSFYQYFEDKEDLFYYLLEDHTEQMKQQFTDYLLAHNGDLFAAMKAFYQCIVEKQDNFYFYRNTFLHMNYKIEHIFANSLYNLERDECAHDFTQLIDTTQLNLTERTELFDVMEIITAVTFRNFIKRYAQELTVEQSVAQYKVELELLQKGLSRAPYTLTPPTAP